MMVLRHKPAGGRGSARQLFVTSGLVLHALIACASAAADNGPYVSVRERQGVYLVAASFRVPESPSAALAVLTDYEHIPRFMPEVTTSLVRERSGRRVLVEQEAVSRMMMFSKRVHLLLDVREEGDTVRFQDVCGGSFEVYAGAWRLSHQDDATVITYELSAKPSFDVPGFLLTRLLKRNAKEMIDRLRIEIASRPEAMAVPSPVR